MIPASPLPARWAIGEVGWETWPTARGGLTAAAGSSTVPLRGERVKEGRDGGLTGHIVVDHVRHAFGARPVLDALSFEVAPHELVCVVGPSGCGKTTLLR